MLPTLGPWCDSAVIKDPAVLVGLAAHTESPLGILANRALTGSQFAVLAAAARLTPTAIHELGGPEYLMVGRSTADQVALVTSAATRSAGSVDLLLCSMGPDLVLALRKKLSGGRFKGSATIGAHLDPAVKRSTFACHARHPDFVEAVLATFRWDHPLAILGRAFSAGQDAAALSALAAEMVEVPDEDVAELRGGLVDAFLLCTLNDPAVVGRWARDGGALGARIAARDPRQGPDTFAAILDRHPLVAQQARSTGIAEELLANPGVGSDLRYAWSAEMLRHCFATNAPAGPAGTSGGPVDEGAIVPFPAPGDGLGGILENRYRWDEDAGQTSSPAARFEQMSEVVSAMLEAAEEFAGLDLRDPASAPVKTLASFCKHDEAEVPAITAWAIAAHLGSALRDPAWVAKTKPKQYGRHLQVYLSCVSRISQAAALPAVVVEDIRATIDALPVGSGDALLISTLQELSVHGEELWFGEEDYTTRVHPGYFTSPQAQQQNVVVHEPGRGRIFAPANEGVADILTSAEQWRRYFETLDVALRGARGSRGRLLPSTHATRTAAAYPSSVDRPARLHALVGSGLGTL